MICGEQMTRHNLNLVHLIASEVREWGENLQQQHSVEMWRENLGGMCGICSCELATRLQAHRFIPYLCVNDYHCWVHIEGWLVDVTATQFGFEPVVLVELSSIPFEETQPFFKRNKQRLSISQRIGSFWINGELVWKPKCRILHIYPFKNEELEQAFQRWPKMQHPLRWNDTGAYVYS